MTDDERSAEERYRALVEVCPDAILLHRDGEIVYANQAAASMLHTPEPDALIGRNILSFVHPDFVDRALERIKRIMQNHDSAELIDYKLYRLDGEVFDGEVSAAWGEFRGEPVSQVVVRDVTPRKQAEEDLRRAHDELEERVEQRTADLRDAKERLEQFASAVSHDLQQPLRAVSGYLQLLERRKSDALDEDAREFVSQAREGAARMQRMIQDLLAYSRLEIGTEERGSVDTDAVVDEAITNLDAAIRDTNARVEREHLPPVHADRSQLLQLFQNLIDNALKFRGHAPPEVAIGARRRNGQWEFLVRDNGIGIEAAQLDRIFDVFRRLHPGDAYEGTGVGLALCKRIVERHGGRLQVDSTPNRGSTFRFTLPAAEQHAASAPA